MSNEYTVELKPPDLSPYANGTDGVPYVHTFAAEAAGPHVALTAVVHGNEPCGAIALDTLLKAGVRPVRGALSVAFINIAAYEAFDAGDPNASRWVEEDFNRLWSDAILSGPRTSVELTRAREIASFIGSVDLLLDIHSMQHTTRPLMMAGPAAKGVALAKRVGAPAEIVVDSGHAAGPRMRDYAPFIDPLGDRNALLVECGQHWEAASADVALETTVRFLRATGAVAPDFWADRVAMDAPPQRVIEIVERVTVDSEAFRFVSPFRGFEIIETAGTVIATDGDREVKTPTNDCVLIMPSKRLWPGQTAVRLGRFVEGAPGD